MRIPMPSGLLRVTRAAAGHGRILAFRMARDSIADRLPGLAAEVAFFVLLSLPPLALVALSVLGFVGQSLGPDTVADIEAQLIEWARAVLAPDTVTDFVQPAVDHLLARGRIEVLSLAMVLGLWSASRATRAIVGAVAVAYDLEDSRPWWANWLLALAMTVAGILILVVLLPLLVLGPDFSARLAARFDLASEFSTLWGLLYWPVVLAVGLTLLTSVYHLVAPYRTPWLRDVPGAAFALAAWLAGSFGLRLYVLWFVRNDSAYSYFGAPLAFLLWVYLSCLALLAGAELNAEIEKMWPRRRGFHGAEA